MIGWGGGLEGRGDLVGGIGIVCRSMPGGGEGERCELELLGIYYFLLEIRIRGKF